MQVTINKKDYSLDFGFKFLKEIDERMGATIDVDGQTINTRTGGLGFLEVGLSGYNPNALIVALSAGLNTLPNGPSYTEIETYVESLILEDIDTYQTLNDGIIDEIKKNVMLKNITKLQEGLKNKKKK